MKVPSLEEKKGRDNTIKVSSPLCLKSNFESSEGGSSLVIKGEGGREQSGHQGDMVREGTVWSSGGHDNLSEGALNHGCSRAVSEGALNHGCSRAVSEGALNHGCSRAVSAERRLQGL